MLLIWEGGEKNIPGAREPRVSASSCEKPCSSLELVLLKSVLLDQKVAEDRLLMLLLYTGLTIGHRKGPVNQKVFCGARLACVWQPGRKSYS